MAIENQRTIDDPKAFRQQVRLATVQVAALGDGELAAALAYELEPFSGIPAAEAEVAWRETPESNPAVKVYDVAVARRRAKGGAQGRGAARRLNAIVCAAALMAALAVAVDALVLAARRAELRRAVAARLPLDGELRRLEERERELREEARAIRERREGAQSAQEKVDAMRSAVPDALGAIAAACGGRIVVKGISSPAPFELEIAAVAVTPESAAATMARLGEAVSAKGWLLEPGGVAAVGAGDMVDFACRLRRVGAKEGK